MKKLVAPLTKAQRDVLATARALGCYIFHDGPRRSGQTSFTHIKGEAAHNGGLVAKAISAFSKRQVRLYVCGDFGYCLATLGWPAISIRRTMN
jgi:hypothetical protein